MRCYDEPIDVRGSDEPAQFLWRNRLWVVRSVQQRWTETGDWWDGPQAQAVRGSGDALGQEALGDEALGATDLLGEEEVWRVVAAAGRHGREGVYELAQVISGAPDQRGTWRLRTVMD
ncbi:MAG: DUF6504 family protein [Propionibacteriales bacterium]|nr:DUF6504 family protein [Propionibacteriales bacterium]